MKLSDFTTNKSDKPFVKTPLLSITMFEDENKKITGMDVTIRNRKKHFKVVNGNTLAAWMKVEKYFKMKV